MLIKQNCSDWDDVHAIALVRTGVYSLCWKFESAGGAMLVQRERKSLPPVTVSPFKVAPPDQSNPITALVPFSDSSVSG
jgi:hypothetical protein